VNHDHGKCDGTAWSRRPGVRAGGAEEATMQGLETSTDNRYKTFWRRLWAAVFDGGVLMNAAAAIIVLCSVVYGPWSVVLYFALLVVVQYSYAISTTYFFSGSFGKRLLNLRVVRADDLNRISFGQSFLREVPNLILSMVELLLLVLLLESLGRTSFLAQLSSKKHHWALDARRYLSTLLVLVELGTCLLHRKRRAFHDLVAGTVVVKDGAGSWAYAVIGVVLIVIGLLAFGAAYKPFINAVLR
jgi:uncharacterized RDD family membrane protein YckC